MPRVPINPLVLSYPNFVLGQIIDPDEANQNNFDITNKVNEFISEVEGALDIAESADVKAEQAVFVANQTTTVANDAVNIANTKGDQAINTANQADSKANQAISTANNAVVVANGAVVTANQSSLLSNDTRMVLDQAMADLTDAINRAEQAVIDAQNAVGNTEIKYDVYVIVNADNGNGTFTYKDVNNVQYIGTITPEGYQRFTLNNNYYVGSNRIEATINDTLTRSQASGGLREVGVANEQSNLVDLSFPVGNDAEITFKYYMQLSLGGKHAMSHNIGGSDAFITLSESDPPTMYAGQMIFKVV